MSIKGSNNNIQGNYIGLDATGNVPIGNARYGILIDEGDNNLIGGSGPQWGNVIAGNGIIGGGPGGGIKLQGGADNNIFTFNNISYNAGSDNEGNEGCGIWIESGSNNTIGGTVTLGDITFSAGNTISWNYSRGARLTAGTDNKFSRNSIFFNGVSQGNPVGIMGIDLGTVGITANDSCDADTGANNLQNFPVLVSAISADNTMTLLGSLNSVPGKTYTIEFFSNTSCSGQGYGQGQTYLGSRTVTLIGQSCSVSFSVTLSTPTLPAGSVITATATDPDGNTSEFSACQTVSGSSLQFSSASYSAAENGGAATITVTRTSGSTTATSVNYATSNGSATAAQDYAQTSGTLNFAAGETSKTFTVPIFDDNFFEGDETINLTLSNVSGGGAVLGDPSTAVLTITDNESQPTISITNVSENEGNGITSYFIFSVSLSVASTQTVSVTYATADGTATTANNDYQVSGATLTFTPNQTTKTFTVPVTGDLSPEPDETFFVNLSNPSNATIADSQSQATILNDDACINSINPTTVNASAGGGTGIVNVTSPCSWSAISNDSWLMITSGDSGSGNGVVTYSVAANPGSLRSGTLTIAGLTFTVNQATGCSLSINQTSKSFAASGGPGSLTVSAPDSCSWTAVSNDSWLMITSGDSGSGNGVVTYSVATNSNPTNRSGTLTIAGYTFTVYQGAAFADVPANHPFYTEIGKLSARGVTLGCGPGNYCPEALVTREQMAAFLLRARGEFNPPQPPNQRFDDVPASNTFYNFIDRLAVLGITQGCSATPPLYCPGQAVTRGQMAAFLVRAFDL